MTPVRHLAARLLGLFMLSTGVLSACTVVVDEPRPRPEPSVPQMCTMEFAPVCGQRGARRQTFPNACQARVDGFEVIGRGECRREGRPDQGRPDEGRPDGSPDDRPQMCTREFDPVCARRGRREQTFPNACTAEADGFRVVGRGECRGAGRPDNRPDERPESRPDDRPQACTREFAPVCARRGENVQTFANDCEAQARGFRVIAGGECR